MPSRQGSTSQSARRTSIAGTSANLSVARSKASTKRATPASSAASRGVTTESYIGDGAAPSYPQGSTSQAPLRERNHPLNKQQSSGAPSRIPVGPRAALTAKVDVKGKGREIPVAEPKRKSPVRRATHQNYSLNESATSDEDEDAYIQPSRPTTSQIKLEEPPVQTPRNNRGMTPKGRTPYSSAGGQGSVRARTASLAPSEAWSSMKPIPLKTVYLSSPPRPDRSSETESSSESEDEVRLLEAPTTSARKRKAAAGEYTWDERSRSCVPKRERSRSRSLTASAHQQRYGDHQPVDEEDGDPANDRSHLQDKVYPTSENDLLRSLLTNRLHAKARLEQSSPAKGLQLEDHRDPFLASVVDDHIPTIQDETDMIMDIPDTQEDDLAAQGPIFDFSYSGLPDDDSDDDGFSTGRRTAFSSSDDGFERSVIHLQDPLNEEVMPLQDRQGDDAPATEEEMNEFPYLAEGIKSENVEVEVYVNLEAQPSTHTRPLSSDATVLLPDDDAGLGRASSQQLEHPSVLPMVEIQEATLEISILSEENGEDIAQLPPEDLQVSSSRQTADLSQAEQALRSPSAVSDLPPSSPPPLPSDAPESAMSEDDEQAEAYMPVTRVAQPPSPSAAPLSPKTTNRLARPSHMSRSPSPGYSHKLGKPYAIGDAFNKANSPSMLALLRDHLPQNVSPNQHVDNKAKASTPGAKSASAVVRSPSPAQRQLPGTGLRTPSKGQSMFRSASPRLAKMTPVRLRTASPAALASYNMVETHATPPLNFVDSLRTMEAVPDIESAPRSRSPASKIEAFSPLQPSAAVFGAVLSPLLSPNVSKIGSITLSPTGSRLASRSPSPLVPECVPEKERGEPSHAVYGTLLTTPGAAHRQAKTGLLGPTSQSPTMLQPPSPFLSHQSRTPSPNLQAEEAAANLLARVRALRSPSVMQMTELPVRVTSGSPQVKEGSFTELEPTPDTIELDEVSGDEARRSAYAHQPQGRPGFSTQVRISSANDTLEAAEKGEAATPRTSIEHPVRALESSDISDTGLTDGMSVSDTDIENAEVERALSQARTPSRSPKPNIVLLPLEDSQLSPNVTLRRERSTSRSTASARSNKHQAKSPLRTARRMSFTEIGALDSSPLSVAASIGRASFDALDSSSEEDEDGEGVSRPSPSKEIAAQQMRNPAVEENELGSSDDEEMDLSSSPSRNAPTQLGSASAPSTPVLQNTSTPARLMNTLAIGSSDGDLSAPVAVSTPNPKRRPVSNPKPACSPDQSEMDDGVLRDVNFEEPHPTYESVSPIQAGVRTADLESGELQAVKVESSQSSQGWHKSDESADSVQQDQSDVHDTSAILDEARPRTSLVIPPVASIARPSPARSARSNATKGGGHSTLAAAPEALTSSTRADLASDGTPSRRSTRSHSVVSRQESVTSQASTVVQVSSADPMAAARAAAILKVHHHYIQEGVWPAGVNPLSRAASGSSEEGERALDDLLKQAEREVSVAVQETSTAVHTHDEASCEESSMEVSVTDYDQERRERSISASRHFIDQSKLHQWTRHDWRALEQCFIDELRRKRGSREQVEPAEVVKLYLESEQLKPEQCIGQWRPDLLEIRVQALIARKKQKAPRATRERSHSVASTAYSRAPSDFFNDEDAQMHGEEGSENAADVTYLDIPGALLSPGRRRYARSAEPMVGEQKYGQQDYARHRGISKYQSLQRRLPTHLPLSRETSLSSVAEAEETQSVASEPPPSSVSRGVSRLYPSLDELRVEMKPKKLIPVRGRSVAAAVNLFEKIEEEQSMEAHFEQAWLKRKASEQDLRTFDESNKRIRM